MRNTHLNSCATAYSTTFPYGVCVFGVGDDIPNNEEWVQTDLNSYCYVDVRSILRLKISTAIHEIIKLYKLQMSCENWILHLVLL